MDFVFYSINYTNYYEKLKNKYFAKGVFERNFQGR